MDGLRYRALPLSSRDHARRVERELLDEWQPAWNAPVGGTKAPWFEARYPKVAWAWRWHTNR
jgi:hypothetical protein